MSSVDELIGQAERDIENGEHGNAISNLTRAAQSDPDERQMSMIERLLGMLVDYVRSRDGNGGDGSRDGSRDIGSGSGERGMGTL